MDMGTSTMSGMSSSATSTSSSSMSSSMTMTMAMVFTNSHSTPLFSSTWTPTTSGQYAGTCIFLIILAIIGRCLMAFKAAMERRWLAIALDRRYVVVAGKKTESALSDADSDTIKTGTLTCQGVNETVRVVRQVATETQPWRFSVDLPRAVLALVVTGVSYLLMLAVMTMNVGYFMSVLAGTFIGELAVGRYIVHWSEH